MDKRPIGLFDSGIGGLSVLKELMKKLPNENFIYLGDTKNFPYGNKSKDNIIGFTRNNIDFLMKKNVKLIVIACGTATSQALDIVKDEYNIPIIGIINPTIDYLTKSYQNKETIGVIATNGTIKSKMWETKIKEKINGAKIISEKAPLLAIMAESGWTNNKVAEYTIKEYMKVFKKVDRLILGCTHYPFFKKLIRKELPNIEIIDTGVTVAKYLKNYLKENNLLNNGIGSYEIYLSDYNDEFKELAQKFLNQKDITIKKQF